MNSISTSSVPGKIRKKTISPFKWVRPKSDNDPPKKPLSSYNIFFLLERERIIQGEPERMYELEDVQNIVRVKRWNASHPKKRRHRKAHGKISFHDLSQIVAEKWRSLNDEQKSIFNHQAAIEHKLYKEVMGQWVMKQMNANHPLNTVTSSTTTPRQVTAALSNVTNTMGNTPINVDCLTSPSENHIESNVYNEANDTSTQLLSDTEYAELLGFFGIVQNEASVEPIILEPNNLSDRHDYSSDLYQWKIDDDGPLWYNNAQGYSEEYAVKMIESV